MTLAGARPLVAVVAPLDIPGCGPEITRQMESLASSAVRHLARTGADTWVIDVIAPDRPAPTAVAAADGVVLLGGGDVDPALYGASASAEVYGVDRAMDEHSIEVVRAAVDRGRPVFAICRGAQVLNVALGGTLVTHLEDNGLHRHAEDDRLFVDELITLDDQSWAAGALGRTRIKVRSGHHQAVDRPGEGLRPCGWALDGTVECVQREGGEGFAVGVQWHPEEVEGDGQDATALFGAYVRTVREGR